MRTVYLGTSEFAVDVLRRLAGSGAAPVLVVTPPDRRRGRRRRLLPPPAAAAARELGIDLLQTDEVNDEPSAARIADARPDLALVCAFGQIIREPLLSTLEMLNVHPSLLPRWRGAAPIERAIMAGDPTSGATIARVTSGLDSGPIALTEACDLIAGETYGSLAPRLAEAGARLALEALRLRSGGSLELREQDEAVSTYAEKITPAERRLDPARPAMELERVVRALTPHIGAHLTLGDGKRLGILAARALDGSLPQGLLEVGEEGLLLGCSAGALAIDRVKPASGRPMEAEAYLRGHPRPALATPEG